MQFVSEYECAKRSWIEKNCGRVAAQIVHSTLLNFRVSGPKFTNFLHDVLSLSAVNACIYMAPLWCFRVLIAASFTAAFAPCFRYRAYVAAVEIDVFITSYTSLLFRVGFIVCCYLLDLAAPVRNVLCETSHTKAGHLYQFTVHTLL